MPDVRRTVRLPSKLDDAAEKRAASKGMTVSTYLRELLCADLGVDPPAMSAATRGFASVGKRKLKRLSRDAARKRHGEEGDDAT